MKWERGCQKFVRAKRDRSDKKEMKEETGMELGKPEV
jgi:hypothetical protein